MKRFKISFSVVDYETKPSHSFKYCKTDQHITTDLPAPQ